jgi:predicted RNA-binding Zn-ribbon protein involved in translation (DUF1610 family)
MEKGKMNENQFIRYIVYCNKCNKYVNPNNRNGYVWCPNCGDGNTTGNIEITSLTVMSMEEQKRITENLKKANSEHKKLSPQEMKL